MPVLGYDVVSTKLVVNEHEAAKVRAIFDLYLSLGALLPVVEELTRRGWVNKQWTTRKSRVRGGLPFTKTSLYQFLTSVVYLGKVRYKTEVHEGEHAGIVDLGIWQRVQSLLQRNGRSGGAAVRNKFGAILKGILRCAACDCAMSPSHSTRGNKRYRYYVCTSAQKRDWSTCPARSIPAAEIESFVVDQIKCIGMDPLFAAGRAFTSPARCIDP
jgi:site-specific DNA recombinase